MTDNQQQTNNFQNINVKDLGGSEVEIEGEIMAEKLTEMRKVVLDEHAKDVEVPGFRKGNVPIDMVAKHVGEEKIMRQAAERSLASEYPKILMSHQVDAIGQPEVALTKLAEGNPLGFKIKTAIVPKFELENYKNTAKEEMTKEVSSEPTDEEVEAVIEQIRKQYAENSTPQEAPAENPEKDAESTDETKTASDDSSTERPAEDTGAELPELTDEFVGKLGDFKNVDDFKTKIREQLNTEKEREAQDKKRLATIDRLIEKTEINLPSILVEHELDKMLAQFKNDVARAGMTFEKYLEHINKSEESLKEEWKETAAKKAKMQLILNKIAAEEKIEAGREEIDKKVEEILAEHQKADPSQVRIYVQTMLTNQKVFEFLESQGKSKTEKKD